MSKDKEPRRSSRPTVEGRPTIHPKGHDNGKKEGQIHQQRPLVNGILEQFVNTQTKANQNNKPPHLGTEVPIGKLIPESRAPKQKRKKRPAQKHEEAPPKDPEAAMKTYEEKHGSIVMNEEERQWCYDAIESMQRLPEAERVNFLRSLEEDRKALIIKELIRRKKAAQ